MSLAKALSSNSAYRKLWTAVSRLIFHFYSHLQGLNKMLPPSTSKDFPGGSDGKVSANNAEDLGSIPGLERFPVEGNGNPL